MHVAGHKQRPPLHPLERTFLAVVQVELVFLPWAFGTMHVWSQVTGLALSALGMVIALWPRTYGGDHGLPFGRQRSESGDLKPEGRSGPAQPSGLKFQVSGFSGKASCFRINPLPRLLRFPLFWLGLLLLGYIGLQAYNPSWVWTRNDRSWWLTRVNDIAWLPTSIETPFERFNLWRQFIIYATVWLTVCALWVGITRRKSLHILLGVLVGNAAVLALVGFVHKAGGATKLLWLREFPGAGSFASFVYRNHAGSYFGLIGFCALGLAVWHYFEGRKRMARSTPSAIWLLASLFLLAAVVFSLSRGAIISVGAFALAAVVALLILRLTSSTRSTTPVLVNLTVAVVIVGALGFMVRQMNFHEVQQRFDRLSKMQANDPSVLSRQMARDAAMEMWGDHGLRGVGAGGFRYLYPEYAKKHPAIYKEGRLFWEHAHIDWLQVPIELGAAGSALVLLGGLYGLVGFWRRGGWKHPLALMILLGAGQVMAHALIDFPFQNPAILVTWWALLVISLRWLELDRV